MNLYLYLSNSTKTKQKLRRHCFPGGGRLYDHPDPDLCVLGPVVEAHHSRDKDLHDSDNVQHLDDNGGVRQLWEYDHCIVINQQQQRGNNR